jgi:hypothetical protein
MTNSESASAAAVQPGRPISAGLIALAWVWVAVPFAYAIWQLLAKITQLFG